MNSLAARLQIITDLLKPQPIYNNDGTAIVGYTAPLITPEQARELLSNMGDI